MDEYNNWVACDNMILLDLDSDDMRIKSFSELEKSLVINI